MMLFAAVLACLGTVAVWNSPGFAQPQATGKPAVASQDPTVVVDLVRQDSSDCTNSNVSGKDPALDDGTITVTRLAGDTTSVKVAMTVKPDTTYHFFLKCVRELGEIKTGDEGLGGATFTFPTSAVGDVFAFDMYPDGAPPGNTYQSVQVKF
jgi:hypothetical protein